MSPAVHEFIVLDLSALLTGTFAAVTCAILGNFLVLRRLSLLGDAISHAVLPGLVAGFLLSGSRATAPMFIGAGAAGLATVALVDVIRRLARLESGAAMGVVFTVLFALGVVLIEQAAARGVDLDADCVFNGQLERVVFWSAPARWDELLRFSTLAELPRQLPTTAIMLLVTAVLVAAFFKELRICSFDPALATSLGINARLVHAGLMLLVAGAVVASFEAVGSILVIAMLICPAATARMLTDRLTVQVWLSVGIAVLVGIVGYFLGAYGRVWLGGEGALSIAGMMTVVAGGVLLTAILAAPEYGVIARAVRRARAAAAIAQEDLLASLYRAEEAGQAVAVPTLGSGARGSRIKAARALIRRGEASETDGVLGLTGRGRERARGLIRAHRLWESFLVQKLGLRPDHVHGRASALEHHTDPEMAARLAEEAGNRDPHGKAIPGGQ